MSTHVGNADRTVIIPAVEISGTRASKLAQIDALMSRLLTIRRELEGDLRLEPLDHPSRHESSSRGWWLAGVGLALVFVLLTIWAWATAATSLAENVGVVGKVL